MFRVTRLAIAAVLALAVAALPLMLDRCAESCEAHHSATAETPACHHATAPATRITNAPDSCGHDHTGTAGTAAKSVASVERSFAVSAIAAGQPSVAPAVEADVRVDLHSPPDSSPSLAARLLPLRV